MFTWLINLFAARVTDDRERVLGQRGESLAARYLRGKGFKLIVRNFRTEMGEIDIIARDGNVLVFIEVKTREADDPSPEEQVNAAKRHQLTKMARLYLGRYGTPQPAARFDVVAIVWPPGGQPQIRHHENAFDATF